VGFYGQLSAIILYLQLNWFAAQAIAQKPHYFLSIAYIDLCRQQPNQNPTDRFVALWRVGVKDAIDGFDLIQLPQLT